MQLPTVLYRCPGPHSRPGGTYAYLGIETPEAHEQAVADGWHMSMPMAIDAYERRNTVVEVVQPEPEQTPSESAVKRRGRPPKSTSEVTEG